MSKFAVQTTHPTTKSFAPLRAILQRKCDCGNHTLAGGECSECAKEKSSIQRTATDDYKSTKVPPIVHEVLNSPGRPLDADTQAFMGSRFASNFSGIQTIDSSVQHYARGLQIGAEGDRYEREADNYADKIMQTGPSNSVNADRSPAKGNFSHIRIHTDAKAAESASAVNAAAYTVSNHIVFGENAYSPNTSSGRRLLAHELTHTLQQAPGMPLSAPHALQKNARPYLARTICMNPDICASARTRETCNLKPRCGYGKSGTCGWIGMINGPHGGCCCLGAQKRPPVPVPVPAPDRRTVMEEIRDFIRRVVESGEDAEEAARQFLSQHPEVRYVLIGAAVVIILATLAEDIATLGAGILDDPATVGVALALIRVAQAGR